MATITVERALSIVEHAEDQFAKGRAIADAFAPFAEGGAHSRSDARTALMIVIADTYRLAAPPTSSQFGTYQSYARSSRMIASRIIFDDPAYRNDAAEDVLALGTEYEAYLVFLETLEPNHSNYWPLVYERLGLSYAAPTSSLQPKKRWWHF